jgi:hypothetical protein
VPKLLLLLVVVEQMMLKMVLRMMRNSVKKKAGFDINDVAPIDLVSTSAVPAVFGHGKQDTFINISHSGGCGCCMRAGQVRCSDALSLESAWGQQ